MYYRDNWVDRNIYNVFKKKNNIVIKLLILSILAIISILVFIGFKINIDSQNTESSYINWYDTYEKDNNQNTSDTNISFHLSGMKVLDNKSAYIDECKKAYSNFNTKAYLYIIIQTILIIFIFYLAYRLNNIQEKNEIAKKDEEVLFDEVENVKIGGTKRE